jgi:hypothetical protein
MMKKLVAAWAFLLPAFILPVFGQTDVAAFKNGLVKLKSFYSNNIVEKAYLQFDRPGYAAGDTIYFKAYVTIGEQHELSGQSGVLYADLIGPRNVIRQSIMLQISGGLAWGDFALPDTLTEGNYRIRAYTKLMAHETGACFFDQTLPVYSGINNSAAIYKPVASLNKPGIQFFPEGGSLLAGVESKLAFKAIGQDGLGIAVKGVITDNSGKTITDFSSSHLGMGAVNFTPEAGKTYTADVVFGNGAKNTVKLPAASGNGAVLAIDNSDSSAVTIGIRCTSAFFNQNKDKTFGIIINSGVSVSSVLLKLVNPLLAFDLNKKQFHTGIVQFTLFSPEGQPLSERLAFMRGNQLLKLNVSTDKSVYKPGEKVLVNLIAQSNPGGMTPGHFSAAVADESKIPAGENNESSMLSWLLLSSDLNGYIEQPNYYFENATAETGANLDLLMLTQNYRRFKWGPLLAGKYPAVAFKPEKTPAISGRILTPQGKPVANDKVTLICLDGGPLLGQETDSAGRFNFMDLSLSKGNHYMLKESAAKNGNKNLIQYLPDKPEPVLTLGYRLPGPAAASGPKTAQLRVNEPVSNLKTSASIVKTMKEPGAKESDNDSFRSRMGAADQVVTSNELKGSGTLSSHLNGLLNGIVFRADPSSDEKVPYLAGAVTLGGGNMSGNPPMQVIVDGVALPPGSGIDDINLNDVASVEVYKSSGSGISGAQGMGGVLCVYTINGAGPSENQKTASGTLNITLPGFYRPHGFYAPQYNGRGNAPTPKNSGPTVYWNPNLATDKNGRASFSYYNADGKGTYRIIIEGIDENGNIGWQEYKYGVR